MAYRDKEKERKNRRDYQRKLRKNMSEEEKEVLRAKHREYYKKNREKRLADSKAYRANNKEKVSKNRRKAGLRHRYGVSVEWWDKQFRKQKGRCAICGKHQSELSQRLYVDHNHETEEVRGLLCMTCNFQVGQYENMDVKAIKEYLNKHK